MTSLRNIFGSAVFLALSSAQAQSDTLPQPLPTRLDWVTVDDSIAVFQKYKNDRPLAYFDRYTQKALERDTTPIGNVGEIAFLVVDPQAGFCSPKYHGNLQTERVCERLKTIVPDFRKAGVDVYNIAYVMLLAGTKKENFYIYQPGTSDRYIKKRSESAFAGSNIDDILIKDKKNTLVVTGVNLNVCLRETVLDALDLGYRVYVPIDLVGNNAGDHLAVTYILEMKARGAHITHSQDLIKRLVPAAP